MSGYLGQCYDYVLTSGLLYLNSLDKSVSYLRDAWLLSFRHLSERRFLLGVLF